MAASNSYVVLRELLKATAAFTGLPFLRASSRALASQFGADFVFITHALDNSAGAVRMLAAWRDGEEVSGWEFALAGTPCELIYHTDLDEEWQQARTGSGVMIASNVCRRFASTRDTCYQSFIGVPLWNAERQMAGHVALFFERDLGADVESSVMFELVELFSLKVQSELGRLLLEQARDQYVQDLKDLNRKLLHESITDSLTQLYNRRYFAERMQQAYARFKRSADPYALVLLDVDSFKRINDGHGHDVGDTVLRAIAAVLRENTRADVEVVCRTGGEEFAIVCHGRLTPELLAELGQRINHAVRQHAFGDDCGLTEEVTVSIGAALPAMQDNSWNAMYVRADTAMYQAKSAGGDRTALA